MPDPRAGAAEPCAFPTAFAGMGLFFEVNMLKMPITVLRKSNICLSWAGNDDAASREGLTCRKPNSVMDFHLDPLVGASPNYRLITRLLATPGSQALAARTSISPLMVFSRHRGSGFERQGISGS